jgi:hypothetical protein
VASPALNAAEPSLGITTAQFPAKKGVRHCEHDRKRKFGFFRLNLQKKTCPDLWFSQE